MTSAMTRTWRWLALATVTANVAFNYLSESVLNFGKDSPVVTDQFAPLFRPANFAFSIWGLIYATLIAYTVYALTPSQRSVRLHDRLSVPIVVANVLASIWIVAFRYMYIGQSLVVMSVIVGTAVVMYRRAQDASFVTRSYEPVSSLVTVPFSLFLGWISVAAIANTAIFTRWAGLEAYEPGAVTWLAIELALATAIAIGVAARNRDGIVPAVVSWASFAIWVHVREVNEVAGGIALATGIINAVVGAYFLGTSSFMAYQLRREQAQRSVAIVVANKSSHA